MSYAERLRRSVRRFTPEDRPELEAFQREMFGFEARQSRRDYFEWLYEANPSVPQGELPLWILERQGKVVGQQGGIPVPLRIDGRTYSGQWAVDLMVRPEWRMRGVGPALSSAHVEGCDVALALSVSDDAYKAFLSDGWTDMGKLPFFVRPLDAKRLLTERGAPWWLMELTRMAPRGVVGATAWAMSRVLERVSGSHLETVEAFDERVDALWAGAAADYPIAVRRDLAQLRWRFDVGAHRDRYHRFYLTHRDELVGYVVTRVEKWHGLPMGRIVDHFSPMRWTAPLLGEVVEALHAQGVVAVFYEGLDVRAERALRALGFLPGPSITRFMFKARAPLPVDGAWLANPENWLVTDGDADREL